MLIRGIAEWKCPEQKTQTRSCLTSTQINTDRGNRRTTLTPLHRFNVLVTIKRGSGWESERETKRARDRQTDRQRQIDRDRERVYVRTRNKIACKHVCMLACVRAWCVPACVCDWLVCPLSRPREGRSTGKCQRSWWNQAKQCRVYPTTDWFCCQLFLTTVLITARQQP